MRNPGHLDAIRRLARQRVVRATDRVTDEVKALLKEPGLGVKHPGLPNPSSLPGDPPTTQTGFLSITQTTRGPVDTEHGVAAASGTDTVYAFWLQVGTVLIQPRPYMLRALLAARQRVLAAFGVGASSAPAATADPTGGDA